MVTQYDDKGKIFTQVISKKPVPVIIQTTKPHDPRDGSRSRR